MRMVDIIRKKRDCESLQPEDIKFFVKGYAESRVTDYHAAALLMAIYLNGMTEDEQLCLTNEMLHSGQVLDWSDIPGVKVDKHSTGGVGDKTSLILAPIAAAAGVVVPMISGRGLGHTGGTLDKLESIPGFDVSIGSEKFREVLSSTGMVLAGQTSQVAPADKKLYALRDVTATVESIPLIASSILSKKLAEGINALVLDVKVGSGAFMKKQSDAMALAKTLVKIGKKGGKRVVALITDMNQPLGTHVGNSLEVIESCEVLRGRVQNDLSELSFELAAYMMVLGDVADNLESAKAKVGKLIQSGAAFRKFQEVIAAQGGDALALDDYSRLPTANKTVSVQAGETGIVQRIHAEEVGIAAMVLGAGRAKVDDVIDAGAGIVLHNKVGDSVEKGATFATVYYNDGKNLEEARSRLFAAYTIGKEPPAKVKLIQSVIS